MATPSATNKPGRSVITTLYPTALTPHTSPSSSWHADGQVNIVNFDKPSSRSNPALQPVQLIMKTTAIPAQLQ